MLVSAAVFTDYKKSSENFLKCEHMFSIILIVVKTLFRKERLFITSKISATELLKNF